MVLFNGDSITWLIVLLSHQLHSTKCLCQILEKKKKKRRKIWEKAEFQSDHKVVVCVFFFNLIWLFSFDFNLQNTKRVPWIASQPSRETPCSGLGTLRSWHRPRQSQQCLSVSFSFSFGPCPWKTEKRAEEREEKHLSRCRHRLRSKSIPAQAKQEMINLQCSEVSPSPAYPLAWGYRFTEGGNVCVCCVHVCGACTYRSRCDV